MSKIRVHEVAKEVGMTSKEVVAKSKEIGLILKAAQSPMTIKEAEELTKFLMTGKKPDENKTLKPKLKVNISESEIKSENKSDVKKVERNKVILNSKEENKKEESIKSEKKNNLKENGSKENDSKKNNSKEKIEKTEKVSTIKKAPLKNDKNNKKSSEKNSEKIKSKSDRKRPKDKLGQIGLKRRTSLKIIKKVNPTKTTKPIVKTKDNASNSISELFKKSETSQTAIDKKKKKTKIVAKKQSNKGNFLEFDRGFNDNSSSKDIFENEVLLVDISQVDAPKIEEDVNKNNNKKNNKKGKGKGKKRNIQRVIKKRIRKTPKELEKITKAVIPEDIRVYEFAEEIGVTTSEVISKLFALGLMFTKNDFLESDVIEILGDEFDVEIEVKDVLEELSYQTEVVEIDENLEERPPIITIMGHVDHGKTSLLDSIRSSDTAHKEAGGITQHIGAYSIERNSHKLTFIDTPGHSAFSQMRARGAKITDIIIIVVAADDGVKPQTIEAIKHAKESGVALLVAVNKIDKPDANPDLAMSQMAEHGITPVAWGGDYEFINLSAKTGEGIDELLDTILLQAEILELKANPNVNAQAVVVESSMEKGKGVVATVIVQNGTLNLADTVVADTTFGRVKAMTDDMGNRLKSIPPSGTAKILGLGSAPMAGSILVSMDSEKEARDIAKKRAEHKRQKELSKSTKVSIEELSGLIAEGKIKSLPVILKGDVQGSVEAIKNSLEALRNDEVKVNIIHSGVGGITESDIALAAASSNTVILGFNIRPTGSVKSKATSEGIEIKTYSVIYDLLDDIKATLAGMMSPIIREENSGQAEVRDIFTIAKVGTIAGCMVSDGSVIRGGKARLIRDGIVIHEGLINSLKRFKDEAKEVKKGYECGIMLDNFNDIQVGDYIETFTNVEEQAKYE